MLHPLVQRRGSGLNLDTTTFERHPIHRDTSSFRLTVDLPKFRQ